MFLWYPVMDLARAPRRTARKKGSGYENDLTRKDVVNYPLGQGQSEKLSQSRCIYIDACFERLMRGDKEALQVKAMERLLENCEYSVNNFYAT
jgi:hypothetical protein